MLEVPISAAVEQRPISLRKGQDRCGAFVGPNALLQIDGPPGDPKEGRVPKGNVGYPGQGQHIRVQN